LTNKRIKPVIIGDRTILEVDLGISEIWVDGWGVNRPTGFQGFECDRKELEPKGWDLENHVLCYDERKYGYLLCRILGRCGKEGRFLEPKTLPVTQIGPVTKE
jgi:hypothetical protein